MMEKVNELVKKINESETELGKIEKELLKCDMDRINKVAQVAVKGIKICRIYSKFVTYNDGINWSDDKYSYFKDEEGKFQKGVLIVSEELSSNNSEDGTGNRSERELFLMADGTFKVFYKKEEWSSWEDNSEDSRIISKNQDVCQFDFDLILRNIIKELNGKLEKTLARRKTQSNRLERLNELKIE